MLMDFDSLQDTARVWIYQSSRKFSDNEVGEIKNKLDIFISNWKRHGDDLKASYKIRYNQFIIMAVEENYNKISGCSIDESVNFMKQLENDFSTDLTNKLNISFKDNNSIKVVSLSEFQFYAKQEKISANTIVFNNMVTTKADFVNNWEVTANKSWHKRFLVQ